MYVAAGWEEVVVVVGGRCQWRWAGGEMIGDRRDRRSERGSWFCSCVTRSLHTMTTPCGLHSSQEAVLTSSVCQCHPHPPPPGSHINHYLKVTVTLQVTVQLGDICRNYYHSINIFQYSKRKKMMFKRIHFDSDLYITWDRTHHTQQECTVNQNTIKKLQYSQVQFPNLRRCNSFVKVKCVTKQVLQCCWDTPAHESWSPDVIKTCLFGTDSKKTPLSLSK